MRKIERENTGNLKPGQDLLVAGYAGLAGSIHLLKAKEEELTRWFSADYMEELRRLEEFQLRKDPSFWAENGAVEWEPVLFGGILQAIWTLSGAYETGVEFTLRDIPVRQETIEICERLEVNPYRLYSEGCYLLAADNGMQLAKRLAEQGVYARVIGRVNTGIAREIISEEGRGFLERPHKDEIFKILPKFRKQL